MSLGREVTGSSTGRGGMRGAGTVAWAQPPAAGPAMAKGQRAPCGPCLETKLGTGLLGIDRLAISSPLNAGSALGEGLESAHGRETTECPAGDKLKLHGLFSHPHCLPVKKTQSDTAAPPASLISGGGWGGG